MKMDSYKENELVIDLSTTKSTTQLAAELSDIIDKSDIKDKNICLKLGKLDLRQSQLLSIKALIESIDGNIQSISTASEMTEASAVSLGILLENNTVIDLPHFNDSISEQITTLNNTFADETETDNTKEEVTVEDKISSANNTETVEGKEEITLSKNEEYETKAVEEDNNAELESEAIEKGDEKEDEIVAPKFEKFKPIDDFAKTNIDIVEPKEDTKPVEETETKERSSEEKYVLIDTTGITPEDLEETFENTADLPTLYLTQTLRSGQTVSYEGNIFIVGDAHPGSEVIATGDVTVWGILGGMVHAGSKGNQAAKVRALKLNPIQLRIAGLYSHRNDTINVPFVQKTDEFTPEEARINKKQIVVYKTLRRED